MYNDDRERVLNDVDRPDDYHRGLRQRVRMLDAKTERQLLTAQEFL